VIEAASVLLVALLLAATLGEGGASPGATLAIHSVVALAWVAILLRSDPEGAPVRRAPVAVTASLLAFGAVALVGAVSSPYAYAAWLRLLEMAVFLGVLLLAARVGPRTIDVLPWPLLAWATFQSCLVLAARVFFDEPRPAGTFLNPNHLGAWLVAALLISSGTWQGRPSRRTVVLRVMLAIPVVAAILVIGSRGAFLGLATGMAWLVVASWRSMSRRTRVAVVAAGCLAALTVGAAVVQRFRTPDPYSFHRIHIWQASTRIALDHPWTGTGPGQLAWVARNYQFADGTPPLDYERRFRTTHSDWLRVPVEYGLPGLAALVLVIGTTGWAVTRRRRCDGESPFPLAATAALVAIAAQSAVDNLSERPAVWLLAAVLLGALVSRPTPASGGPGPVARVLGLSMIVVALIAGDAAPYRAWTLSSGLPSGRLNDAGRARLERASELNPLQPDLWMRRAEDLAGDGSDWTLETYARARELAEHAIRLNRADSEMHLRLARIEARACRTLFRDNLSRARALRAFRRAADRARYSATVPLEEGDFLLGTDDPAGALTATRRAMELEPNAIPPRLLAADALVRSGGEESAAEAARLVREAREIAARWGDYRAEDAYSRALLRLDEAAAERIEAAIRELDR
jgi:O-antigen ligase